MLALRKYQIEIVDYIIATKRCNLFVAMGLGKTVSTLTALDTLALIEDDIYPALVLAPLPLRWTWSWRRCGAVVVVEAAGRQLCKASSGNRGTSKSKENEFFFPPSSSSTSRHTSNHPLPYPFFRAPLRSHVLRCSCFSWYV